MTRTSSRRWLPVAVVALVAGALLAGTAGARPDATAATPGPLAGLIKQSKKESGLVFYAQRRRGEPQGRHRPFPVLLPVDQDDGVRPRQQHHLLQVRLRGGAGHAHCRPADLERAEPLGLRGPQEVTSSTTTRSSSSKYPKFAKQYKGIFVISPDPAIIDVQQAAAEGQGAASVTPDGERPAAPTGS